MTDAVTEATATGIKRSKSSIPPAKKEAALTFFYGYAREHRYFTGGDVLSAWRETREAYAHDDWRNQWGAICSMAKKLGWVAKSGRAKPRTTQSHTTTLVRWESLVCAVGAAPAQPTDKARLEQLALAVSTGRSSVGQALWQAYELGTEVR